MSRMAHTVKCKHHTQSEMLFIEEPIKSPHDFKGVCKGCGNKFITWVSIDLLEEIVRDTPNVEIRQRPTTTFDKIFDTE
jgi:hypothetical protein